MWVDFHLFFTDRSSLFARVDRCCYCIKGGFNLFYFVSIFPRSTETKTVINISLHTLYIFSVKLNEKLNYIFLIYWFVVKSILRAISHPFFDKFASK